MNYAQKNSGDISTEGLTKNFGAVAALRGINLHIPSGQTVAIMGPSGSGKSTLLHCLSGVIAPSSGHIYFQNQDISQAHDKARSKLRLHNFGFVFQDGQLVPELSGLENVAIPLLLQGMKRGEAFDKAYSWLTKLGVGSEGNRRPGEMSGGQMQRVAIARAIAGSPDIIFADEPTGALDQATGHEVIQILTTAARMNQSSLIIVTHDPKVAQWCERIIEIRDGLIHADTHNPGQAGAAESQVASW